MRIFSLRRRGAVVASAVLAAGAAGTVLDPDGPVGITLFGLAAAAALYLLAGPFAAGVRRLVGARRRTHMPPLTVVPVVRGRTVATVVATMGVLFTSWLTADLARPLVYASWWAFCALAAWLTVVAALTTHRSLRAGGEPVS